MKLHISLCCIRRSVTQKAYRYKRRAAFFLTARERQRNHISPKNVPRIIIPISFQYNNTAQRVKRAIKKSLHMLSLSLAVAFERAASLSRSSPRQPKFHKERAGFGPVTDERISSYRGPILSPNAARPPMFGDLWESAFIALA